MSTTTTTFQKLPTIVVGLGLLTITVVGLLACGALLMAAAPAILPAATMITLTNNTEAVAVQQAPGSTVIVVTATSAPTPTSATGVTIHLTSGMTPGLFLVDIDGMTLYTFSQDTPTTSVCTGECANTWTPLMVAADTRLAGGEGVGGQLATITREDGTLQVTYNGQPLYRYSQDVAAGDTKGQGVDNQWYVAAP